MKKIFLTSGIIACMACPAFATGSGFSTSDVTTAASNNNVVANACTEPVLGVPEGETTLRAIWDIAYKTVSFNTNSSENGYSSGTLAPSPLYIVHENNNTTHTAYKAKNDSTGVLSGIVTENDDNGFLTSTPTGINVNFTVYLNDSTESNGSTAATGGVTEQNGTERTFKGITADPDGGNILIGSDGKLTSAGTTAIAGVSADTTWYAQYNAVHPSVTTPSRDGYQFSGWSLTRNGSAIDDFANYNIERTTDIYALWTAESWTVQYNCGASNNNSSLTGAWTAPTGWSGNSQNATFDANFTHPTGENVCSLTGHTFNRWNCVVGSNASTSDGITNNGVSNGKWVYDAGTTGGTITCTAVWNANTIGEITWDDNNATTASDKTSATKTCSYDSNVTLPTTPSKTGYTFGGWQVVTQQ